MKTLKDFQVNGKRVLVRCDFNVPIDEQGFILDDFRIRQTLPTIQYLIKKGAKIILMSHLGEPNGQVVPTLTLDKVQNRLAILLNRPITKTPDCVGYEIEKYSYGLNPGEIMLLENLRFHIEETTNDEDFAIKLARNGDIYINDAFGVCHRPHASVVGVPQHIPGGIGLLFEKEIANIDKIIKNPKRPMLAIIGGKKVETKSKVLEKILEIADRVIISGLIKQEIDEKKMWFNHAEKIISPVDNIIVNKQESTLDIGKKSIKLFKKKIKLAKTIFWNGPFGKTEDPVYEKGTLAIAKRIARRWFCFTVIGGGETVEFVSRHGLIKKFDHVSTGGGAMLAYISGEELPGIQVLNIKWEEKEK